MVKTYQKAAALLLALALILRFLCLRRQRKQPRRACR